MGRYREQCRQAVRVAASVLLTCGMFSTVRAEFSRIVVFGDSLSDTGNAVTRHRIPASPPYDGGRFSNGKLWVESLADYLNLPRPDASQLGGSNYAWGGATTGSWDRTVFPVPNVDDQVAEYLGEATPQPDELFVLWAGVNDIGLGQSNPALPAQLMADRVEQLAEAGARHFLVANLPQRLSPGCCRGLAPRFNSQLDASLQAIAETRADVQITQVDVFGLFNAMLAEPDAFGFADVNRPACRDCSYGEAPNPVDIVESPDSYFYWDLIHPTAAAHRYLGDAAVNRLLMASGDLDQNGLLDANDLDLLASAIRSGDNVVRYEMDGNWILDLADHTFWIKEQKQTWLGDANLDGEFNSSDLIEVFAAGKYESGETVGWAEGDWDANGRFDTGDLVVAFADGGYEQGQRPAMIVPEPPTLTLLCLGGILSRRRRREPK